MVGMYYFYKTFYTLKIKYNLKNRNMTLKHRQTHINSQVLYVNLLLHAGYYI